jgi:hypothetical protein
MRLWALREKERDPLEVPVYLFQVSDKIIPKTTKKSIQDGIIRPSKHSNLLDARISFASGYSVRRREKSSHSLLRSPL